MIAATFIFASCSDTDEYEKVENNLVGTWKTEAITSNKQDAIVQHIFTIWKDADGIPGSLNHYKWDVVLGDGSIQLKEKGWIGHPNGQTKDVWELETEDRGLKNG